MRTYLRGYDAHHAFLHLGDDLDVAGEHVADWDYLVVREPAADEPVHLLEIWRCPSCRAWSLAEVVVRNGIFEHIALVAPSRPLLDRVHGVSFGLGDIYHEITGVLLRQDGRERPDWLERLRDSLPPDGSAWVPPEKDPA
ncbi:Hypothetical protein A7982_01027 [Minicystis rosea]|nr:Hypothetical protein A7982_01027 [Minicystis rosea]